MMPAPKQTFPSISRIPPPTYPKPGPQALAVFRVIHTYQWWLRIYRVDPPGTRLKKRDSKDSGKGKDQPATCYSAFCLMWDDSSTFTSETSTGINRWFVDGNKLIDIMIYYGKENIYTWLVYNFS